MRRGAFVGGRPRKPEVDCRNHPGEMAFVKSRALCRNCYNREPDQRVKRNAYKRRIYAEAKAA